MPRTYEQQRKIIESGRSVIARDPATGRRRIVNRVQDLPGHANAVQGPPAGGSDTSGGGPAEGAGATPLPGDFPHADTLRAAGLETIEKVRAVEDLTSINGVGKAGAEQIRAALAG